MTATQENITKAAHGAAMLMWDLHAAYESARQGTAEILFADALRRAAELNAQIAVLRDMVKEPGNE